MIFFIFISQSYYFYMHMDVNSPPIHSPTHPLSLKKNRVEVRVEHGTKDGIITYVYFF